MAHIRTSAGSFGLGLACPLYFARLSSAKIQMNLKGAALLSFLLAFPFSPGYWRWVDSQITYVPPHGGLYSCKREFGPAPFLLS